MGTWEKSSGDVLFGYEAELWDRYPRYVVRAFFAVSYDDIIPITEGDVYDEAAEVSKAIDAFSKRWGGFSDEVLIHVLKSAQDRDRLAAIFAIGHSQLSNAVDLLAPLLNDPDLLVRYAAAIMMGFRRDERAFPLLEEYLLADEPRIEAKNPRTGQTILQIQPEAQIWFGKYRAYIAGLFASYGPTSVTGVLRQAFLKYWEQERNNDRLLDGLLYALGQRGALASLHGMALPDFHQRLTMIYLALGAIRADERFDNPYRDNLYHEMIINSGLKQEVAAIGITHFGLSKQEAEQWVNSYASDYQRCRKA